MGHEDFCSLDYGDTVANVGFRPPVCRTCDPLVPNFECFPHVAARLHALASSPSKARRLAPEPFRSHDVAVSVIPTTAVIWYGAKKKVGGGPGRKALEV